MRRSPGSRGRAGARPPRLVLGCALGLVLAAPGCGDDASPVDAEPTPKATIVIRDGAYRPDALRIEAGTRVTWVNASNASHTAETPDAGFYEVDRRKLARRGLFDIHTLKSGEAESVLFELPGKYGYGSSYDPQMWGTIEVVESGG